LTVRAGIPGAPGRAIGCVVVVAADAGMGVVPVWRTDVSAIV